MTNTLHLFKNTKNNNMIRQQSTFYIALDSATIPYTRLLAGRIQLCKSQHLRESLKQNYVPFISLWKPFDDFEY